MNTLKDQINLVKGETPFLNVTSSSKLFSIAPDKKRYTWNSRSENQSVKEEIK